MTTKLADRNVLITGGCGSIGSEIVSQLTHRSPNLIRVLDNSEGRLASFRGTFDDRETDIDCVLANIRDKDQLRIAMRDIDIVFHVAAMKHVPMVEDNPYGAVQTNIDGTRNAVEAAADTDVDRLLAVSTDKAANPTSTMGSTKLIAERIVTSFDKHRPSGDLTLGSVRFGNVVGTKGSVVPLFYDQLASGGPLTVTDPSMTRFVMAPSEAAQFAIESCLEMEGGEVFVKKMPALRVGDLAEAMRSHYAPQFGYEPEEIEIDLIGAKPGERYHEKLVAEDERRYTEEREDDFVLYPHYDDLAFTNSLDGEYTSSCTQQLTRQEIISIVQEALDEPADSVAGDTASESTSPPGSKPPEPAVAEFGDSNE